MTYAASCDDRNTDCLFHQLGGGDFPALGTVNVTGHDIILVIDGASGRNGYHVGSGSLDERCNLGALLRRYAVQTVGAFAFRVVEALHLDGDYLVWANNLADTAYSLGGEAGAVFDLFPAILICTMVEERRAALAGQVAVAGLELYAVGPGRHRALCCGDELVLDVAYLVYAQLVDGLGLDAGVVGRTGVPELEEYLGAVLVRGSGEAAQPGDELVVVDAGLEGQDAGPVLVDYHRAGYNDADAASCDGLDVVDVAHGHAVVEVGDGLCHRQEHNAVLDGLAAYFYGFKKLVAHCSSSSYQTNMVSPLARTVISLMLTPQGWFMT